MDSLIKDFRVAYTSMKGDQIAETINPSILLHKTRLQDVWGRGNLRDAQADLDFLFRQDKSRPRMSKEEANGWYEIFLSYWKAVGELLAAEGLRDNTKSSWTTVYEKWKDFTLLVVRGYTHHEFENWTIPCLYVAGRYLRLYAIRADEERRRSGDDAEISFTDDIEPESENNRYLVECSRHLNRIFQICLSDRAPIEESRKWGIYYAINLLFKTFFKLNNASLCKGVLKALSATSKDMPSIDKFPKSQQVTFKYYEGVLAFLEEDYVKAEQHLTQAWHFCHKDATSNLELILSYLVPCHLLTTHTLPSAQLLAPYPKLQKLFLPLAESIKKADLHAFDVALQESEDEFIRRRIYLTLERGRDITLRNLLRKVFLAGGFENAAGSSAPVRRTRISVSEFTAAINLSSQQKTDPEEVECLLANMIYKNLMKGYIAHERGIVVLSKNGAFPGTGV